MKKIRFAAVMLCLLVFFCYCGKKEDISYTEESLEKMASFIGDTSFGCSHDEVFSKKNDQASEIFNLRLFDDYKSYLDNPTVVPNYLEFYSLWKLWDSYEGNAIGRANFEYYNDRLFSVSYICNPERSTDRDVVVANQDSVVKALVKKTEKSGYVRQEDISSWWAMYEDIDGERFLAEVFEDEIAGEVFPGLWEPYSYTDDLEANPPSEKPMIWFVSEDEKTLLAIAPVDVLRSCEAQNREYPTDKHSKDYYYGYVYVVQYDIHTVKEILSNYSPETFGGKYYELPFSVENVLDYNEKK